MLEGNIILPYGIDINIEALGSQFPIIIAGYNGIVGLPRVDPQWANEDCWRPGMLLLPPKDIEFLKNTGQWGELDDWPIGKAEVKAFRVWFPINDINESKQVGQIITDSFDKWLESFLEYLQIISSTLFGAPKTVTIDTSGSGKALSLYYKVSNKTIALAYGKKSPILVTVEKRSRINKKELEIAFKASSTGDKVALEYSILLDGLKALLLTKDYRKAIVDAATALEVALTNVIRKVLSVYNNPNPDFINDLLYKYQALAGRLRLAKILNINLPTINNKGEKINYQNDIATPRNDAVHFGKTPTFEEANKAVRIVEEVIQILSPINQ